MRRNDRSIRRRALGGPAASLVVALALPGAALAGSFSFTVRSLGPQTLISPPVFNAADFYFMVTNTGSSDDTLFMESDTSVFYFPPNWINSGICDDHVCYGETHAFVVPAGDSLETHVSVVPLSGGVNGTTIYRTTSAGSGQSEAFALNVLYDAVGAPVEAAVAPLSLSARPNPFNPHTTVTFEVPSSGRVRLEIFDVSGKLVSTLVDDVRAAGRHDVSWEGTDEAGRAVSSGVYFSRLTTAAGVETRRLVLLR